MSALSIVMNDTTCGEKSQLTYSNSSPARMIFFIEPDGGLLQRAHILLEDLELNGTRADPARLGGDDDVSPPLLGGRQSDDLALGFPFRNEKTVCTVDKNACQVL